MAESNEEVRQTIDFWEAINHLFFWYKQVVREYSKSYASERKNFIKITAEAEELDDDDDVDEWAVDEHMQDWLHELVDGCEEVIYTMRARAVVMCSDNNDAYIDAFGQEPATVEQQAYFALLTDIVESFWRYDDVEK